MSTDNTLKYKKRNWCKISLYSYGAGALSKNGYYQEVIFYKKNGTMIAMSSTKEVVDEIMKHKLGTKFNLWFGIQSRSYNDKYYTTLILRHYELSGRRPEENKREQEYIQSLNPIKNSHNGRKD